MIDIVLSAVATPAWWKFHPHDLKLFVAKRWQGIGLRSPGCQRTFQPLGVVAARKVLAEVRAATFSPLQSTVSDTQCELKHLLHSISSDKFRIRTARLVTQADVP